MSSLKEINGRYYKTANVVMLPAKDKAQIMMWTEKGQRNDLFLKKPINIHPADITYQHLYITSNEEIKKNDWIYSKMDGYPIQWDGDLSETKNPKEYGYNKIIATTNKSLEFDEDIPGIIKYKSLPQPSESFIKAYIEAYNNDKVINKVMVEYVVDYNIKCNIPIHICKVLTNDKIGCENCNQAHWKLKIDKDNCITIKPIKDSWNREEVKTLLNSLIKADFLDFTNEYGITGWKAFDKWVEENL